MRREPSIPSLLRSPSDSTLDCANTYYLVARITTITSPEIEGLYTASLLPLRVGPHWSRFKGPGEAWQVSLIPLLLECPSQI